MIWLGSIFSCTPSGLCVDDVGKVVEAGQLDDDVVVFESSLWSTAFFSLSEEVFNWLDMLSMIADLSGDMLT